MNTVNTEATVNQKDINIDLYKKFEKKYLNNFVPEEGNFVIIETIEGCNTVVVKETAQGKTFIEAVETRKSKDCIIVELKELNSKNYIKVCPLEHAIFMLLNKGYSILLTKDKKIIKDKNEKVILETSFLMLESMMEVLLDKKH